MKLRIQMMVDKFFAALAWSVPPKFVYWCATRLFVHATAGRYSRQVVPELTALEALGRWHRDKIAR